MANLTTVGDGTEARTAERKARGLSLDGWAVLLALAAAALVRFHVITSVKW